MWTINHFCSTLGQVVNTPVRTRSTVLLLLRGVVTFCRVLSSSANLLVEDARSRSSVSVMGCPICRASETRGTRGGKRDPRASPETLEACFRVLVKRTPRIEAVSGKSNSSSVAPARPLFLNQLEQFKFNFKRFFVLVLLCVAAKRPVFSTELAFRVAGSEMQGK